MKLRIRIIGERKVRSLIGILLCKFDEERGYIPVKVFPSKLRKRKYENIYKEIARNAIGFGSQVEYQAFTLSEIDGIPEVNCLAKRFSISVTEARGGTTLYALVLFSGDSETFEKQILGDSTEQLIDHWEKRSEIIEGLYAQINPEVGETPIVSQASPEVGAVARPLLPKELFIETVGFFAEGFTFIRNALMLISVVGIFWILFSDYNLFSFGFMLVLGIFFFAIIAKKDKSLKIINGFLFFFIILIFLKLSFELVGEPGLVWFLGPFPDFSRPDLALLGIFCGILICVGLDRGNAVDKVSFTIGIIGAIFLVLFFFTPVFEIIWNFFEGLG